MKELLARENTQTDRPGAAQRLNPGKRSRVESRYGVTPTTVLPGASAVGAAVGDPASPSRQDPASAQATSRQDPASAQATSRQDPASAQATMPSRRWMDTWIWGGALGSPLPVATRTRFESRTGEGLGKVRVHNHGHANRKMDEQGARACTVGNDIYFGSGEYRPGTRAGNHLLAHEIAHVVQQRRSGDIRPQFKKKIDNDNSAHERAADDFADDSLADDVDDCGYALTLAEYTVRYESPTYAPWARQRSHARAIAAVHRGMQKPPTAETVANLKAAMATLEDCAHKTPGGVERYRAGLGPRLQSLLDEQQDSLTLTRVRGAVSVDGSVIDPAQPGDDDTRRKLALTLVASLEKTGLELARKLASAGASVGDVANLGKDSSNNVARAMTSNLALLSRMHSAMAALNVLKGLLSTRDGWKSAHNCELLTGKISSLGDLLYRVTAILGGTTTLFSAAGARLALARGNQALAESLSGVALGAHSSVGRMLAAADMLRGATQFLSSPRWSDGYYDGFVRFSTGSASYLANSANALKGAPAGAMVTAGAGAAALVYLEFRGLMAAYLHARLGRLHSLGSIYRIMLMMAQEITAKTDELEKALALASNETRPEEEASLHRVILSLTNELRTRIDTFVESARKPSFYETTPGANQHIRFHLRHLRKPKPTASPEAMLQAAATVLAAIKCVFKDTPNIVRRTIGFDLHRGEKR